MIPAIMPQYVADFSGDADIATVLDDDGRFLFSGAVCEAQAYMDRHCLVDGLSCELVVSPDIHFAFEA